MSQIKEQNFLIGIFGDNFDQCNLVGQALGAPGTKSDILFYNRLDANLGQVFCALTPVDYPEKIKPLLQILTITNIYLLVIDLESGLNAAIGEILVGMDLFHQLFKKKSLVVIANINSKTEWKLDQIKKRLNDILNTISIKGTTIFELRDKSDFDILKTKIIEVGYDLNENNNENQSYTQIFIDHSFPVKGIGTVILGVVKKGIVNTSQMLELVGYEGVGKKVLIRNIQKHDRNFKNAFEGDRVGLALKGNISPGDISRDNMLVSQGIFKQEKEIEANVFINPFYKPKGGIIKPEDSIQYHAIVNLKLSSMKFIEGDELKPDKNGKDKILFDKWLFHDGSGLKGVITELNKFENKSRIVGWFTQLL
ncbi:MAG: hypothetical protein EU532_03670 [Promethearchaeota archaeon]|nr:MAG: hypothetical protein EU532_03670 [Candidatus Lokiarchaeota archaeon]